MQGKVETAGNEPGEALAPLREDVCLHVGVRTLEGAPTHVLQDPATGGFVEIGQREAEVISRWVLGRASVIVARVNSETTFQVGRDDVIGIERFLTSSGLLRIEGRKAFELATQQKARRGGFLNRLLSETLLFRRFPMLAPEPMLASVTPRLAFAYRPGFWLGLALLLMLALYLIARDWSQFQAGLLAMVGLEGAIAIAIALCLSKMVHELAHAVTAHRYGAEVPTMGFALILFWPVLYTETSAAWTVRNRRQRIAIAAAGVASEAVVAVVALALWPVLDPGPLRDAAGFAATTLIVLSLAINANPLMRFDGYFILSEALSIDNMQPRAFALVGWTLRRWIARTRQECPELGLPAGRRRLLLGYGVASLLYRLVLFGGIAWAITLLFFPALGLPVAALVLLLFLVVPFVKETLDIMRIAWKEHDTAGLVRPALIAGMLLAIFLVPWRSTVLAPTMLDIGEAHDVFAPEPALVSAMVVRDGDLVEHNAQLIRLASPQIAADLRRLTDKAAHLDRILDQHLTGQSQHVGIAVKAGELVRVRAEIDGLQARVAKLELAAPVAGRFIGFERGLAPGLWVRPETPIGKIVVTGRPRAIAYVGERDVGLVTPGARVSIWLDGWPDIVVDGNVQALFEQAVKALDEPALATPGGPIAVRPDRRAAGPRRDAGTRAGLLQGATGGVGRSALGRVAADEAARLRTHRNAAAQPRRTPARPHGRPLASRVRLTNCN